MSISTNAKDFRRHEERIAAAVGTTRAQLIVFLRHASGKGTGAVNGTARITAEKRGLLDGDGRVTEAGHRTIKEARRRGF